MAITKLNPIYFIVLLILISHIFTSKSSLGAVFDVSNETDLRNALNIAGNNGENDTINIAAGTYNTGGTPFAYQASPNENFTIAVIGAGSDSTILDGDNLNRVLSVNISSVSNNSNTDITISSITIQNGNTIGGGAGLNITSLSPNARIENCEIKNNTTGSSGGGSLLLAESLVLTNNEFTNNSASTNGAGTFINADTLNLNNNTFMNNTAAGNGGGAFIFDAENTSLSNNRFENNTSTAANGGGALIDSDNVTLSNNNFINNSAGISGGGLRITEAQMGSLTGNQFEGNSANQGGGGVSLNASTEISLNNNTFNNNGSGSDGGGALLETNGIANANANLFMGNISNNAGGGLALQVDVAVLTNNILIKNASISEGGGAKINASTSTMTNNTMTLNSTAGYGGGLAVTLPRDTDITNIYNNIIFDNTSRTTGHDDIFVDDDAIKNNIGAIVNLFNNDVANFFSVCENFIDCVPNISRANNLNADPLFVDAQAGDVHLTEDSPVINQGDPNAPSLPPTDFDGNPRTIGPAPDMGALEFTGPRPRLDLSIEKTSNVSSIPSNQASDIVYTIRIRNIGLEEAAEVVVEDNLPPDAVVESISPGCEEDAPGTVICEVGDLPADGERIFTINVRVTPTVANIINEAIVNFDNREKIAISNIPVISNNPNANVIIEKTSNTSSVIRGRQTLITYNIVLESIGNETAQDVMVIDELPEGSSLVEASEGCVETATGIVQCEIGPLPVGEENVLAMTIDIIPQGSSIINRAIVNFLGGENSDSFTVAVTGGGGGGGCSLLTGESPELGSLSFIAIILLSPLLIIGIKILGRRIFFPPRVAPQFLS